MYELSLYLQRLGRELPVHLPWLMTTHAYRYAHFVRNSPRGVHCRYARASARLYEETDERQQLAGWSSCLPPAARSRLHELLV